jgi:WD40 repeat protein
VEIFSTQAFECSLQITKIKEIQVEPLKRRIWSEISHDGDLLFIFNSGEITTFQPKTLQKVDTIQTEGIVIFGISPDGKTAVVRLDDDRIALWDLAANQEITSLEVPNYHNEWLHLAFSPTEREFAANWGFCEYGGKIAAWNMDTSELIWHNIKGTCAGGAITYSPDGRIIASGETYDRNLHLWDANNGTLQESYLEDQLEWLSAVAFSPSGELLAFGTGSVGEGVLLAPIFIMDPSDYSVLYSFDGKRDTIHSLSFSPEESLLAAGTLDGAIMLWGLQPIEHRCTLDISDNVVDVYFLSEDMLLSVNWDGVLTLWSIAE